MKPETSRARPAARSLVGALLLLTALVPAGARAEPSNPPDRIVAIGDVHGAVDELESLLRELELIDDSGRWVATDTVLVQTGDLVDRGAGTREVLDLMRRLEEEAEAAGSEVRILLGNHEVMALTGDYREVTPEIYATFADESSEKRRKQALQEWRQWLGSVARAMDRPAPRIDKAARQKWLDEHPLGYVEYQAELSPGGEYGQWLLEHGVATLLEGGLYQHAGIAPEWADRTLAEIDAEVVGRIESWEEARIAMVEGGVVPATFHLLEIGSTLDYFVANPFPETSRGDELNALVALGVEARADLFALFREESLIWYRGYTKLPDEELAAHLDRLEEAYGASRFVAGHTPNGSRSIVERLDGRVFLIDAGMLAEVYGGRAAALEIVGDRVYAVYPGERVLLLGADPPPAP